MPFDFEALIVFINSIIIAILTYYARKRANMIQTPRGSDEDMWFAINELQATLNKTLTGVNKQLRSHGRTLQNEEVPEELNKKKKLGMIR